ncbi:MAG TPA: hypothetical protein VIX80_10220 [Candidatus Kapabacteria bacterium]
MIPPVRTRERTAALLPKDYIALEKAREEKERFFTTGEDFDRSVRPFYLDSKQLLALQSHYFLTDRQNSQNGT